jgi:hypothetical protein
METDVKTYPENKFSLYTNYGAEHYSRGPQLLGHLTLDFYGTRRFST